MVGSRVKERATDAQLKKLQESRDCPCDGCSGTLVRIEVWEHDHVILEQYTRHECSCDCDEKKPLVQHYRGRSRGRGCLSGAF